MRQIVAIVVLLCGMGVALAEGGLDIYFVRHAETVKNATGAHDSGNSNVFSDKGSKQVAKLTDRLKTLHFDAILVSPAPRALNTILPYLRETGQKGEIWPELTECCWQQERGAPEAGRLLTGSAIQLDHDQASYFTFRDESARHEYANSSYADGVAQVRRAEALLEQCYFGTGKTILIVGHYHAGEVMLAELLNTSPDQLQGLKNARITRIRQGEDGRFTLITINDYDVAHQ